MYSSLFAFPMRFGSDGGLMHSVLNWRSKVRSPRGRFGSQTMSTRAPGALTPPVMLLTPVSVRPNPWWGPLRIDEIPDTCQLSNTALARRLFHFWLRSGIRYE